MRRLIFKILVWNHFQFSRSVFKLMLIKGPVPDISLILSSWYPSQLLICTHPKMAQPQLVHFVFYHHWTEFVNDLYIDITQVYSVYLNPNGCPRSTWLPKISIWKFKARRPKPGIGNNFSQSVSMGIGKSKNSFRSHSVFATNFLPS